MELVTGDGRDPGASVNGTARALADPTASVGVEVLRFAEGRGFVPIGDAGLSRWGGVVYDEPLWRLRGPRWYRVVRSMLQSPVVKGMLMAVEMLIRQAEWQLDPADDGGTEAEEIADFVESCRRDMWTSWDDTLAQILSFLPYGFSLHEIVYKRRLGQRGRQPSAHDDGLIGWDDWQPRAQETVTRWEFDRHGRVEAFEQEAPMLGRPVTIPLSRCLHFRAGGYRGSPEGEALDPDTPIPTPDGWRRLDDLRPGDKVFDDGGRVRYVTARAEWVKRPCYEVAFSTGERIIADENHRWRVVHRKGDTLTLTTGEIARNVLDYRGAANYGVPWAGPLDYPEQYLPLDPYYLGLWLGDGKSTSPQIFTHEQDVPELVAAISDAGYVARAAPNGPQGGRGRVLHVTGAERYAADGPARLLRALGLLENKHIPPVYLRGSVAQRRDLLAGLMDSDGTVDAWGRCQFDNRNERLIQGVAELVRSLGCAATTGTRSSDGVRRVSFTPPWSPFRLARKATRTLASRARTRHYIREVRSVGPRRTVCIEVDGPSHLFLAGRAMIPTHNSVLRAVYADWDGVNKIQLIEAIGIERDLAGLPVFRIPSALMDPNATAAQAAAYASYKTMGVNLRQGDQAVVILPSERDDAGNLSYELDLLSTGGERQFDTSAVITRRTTQMTMALLADFMQLGHERTGSFALAKEKTSLFLLALQAWLDVIAATINSQAIRRLLVVNGIAPELAPTLRAGAPESANLKEAGDFFKAVLPLVNRLQDEDTEALIAHLWDKADWPAPTQPLAEAPKPLAFQSGEDEVEDAGVADDAESEASTPASDGGAE